LLKVLNAETILEALDETRERLLGALELLPDEALLEQGAVGEWSIADILDHITAWESELVTALMRIDQGKKPARLLEIDADVDGYNAKRFAENRGRALDRIFDDLQRVRLQLEQWLEEFSDRDLTDPGRYQWAQNKPLWQIIKVNSFGHEAEHLTAIETFAAKWQARSMIDSG
jgi:uncharacterized damage-inducible protein DinB